MKRARVEQRGEVVGTGGAQSAPVLPGEKIDDQSEHEATSNAGVSASSRRLPRSQARAQEPVSAVTAMRSAVRPTIAESVQRRTRGCVRTLTAAPTGDATSAATNTIAASGGSICA